MAPTVAEPRPLRLAVDDGAAEGRRTRRRVGDGDRSPRRARRGTAGDDAGRPRPARPGREPTASVDQDDRRRCDHRTPHDPPSLPGRATRGGRSERSGVRASAAAIPVADSRPDARSGGGHGVIRATGRPRPASSRTVAIERPGLHGRLGGADRRLADPGHGDVEVLDVEHQAPERRRAAGRPARSTTSTISPPPPTRWKPWRISPTSRTRLSGAPVASAIAPHVRSSESVATTTWSSPMAPDRVLDEHRAARRRRPRSAGRRSTSIVRGRRPTAPSRRCPARRAGSMRMPGAEQRDQPVDDASARGAATARPAPPTVSHSTRAITTAPRGSRPSCQARNVRPSASSSARLATGLPTPWPARPSW